MKKINQIYQGANQREALFDLYFSKENNSKPLLVFVHGYMGYKDWGAWNLMAEKFYENGFSFAKINLTHNGTTLDNPIEFVDLEVFKNGGYWKELVDVKMFLDFIENKYGINQFVLIGHSRGGGIVLLAGNDVRVKAIHCLAPICDIASRFPMGKDLLLWKEGGVYFRQNGRTGQAMPHAYVQYEEFIENKNELNIEEQSKSLNKPVFVYHGENDEAVSVEEGKKIANWTKGKFYLIKNTAHTFDAKEPWNESEMPPKLNEVVELMMKHVENL